MVALSGGPSSKAKEMERNMSLLKNAFANQYRYLAHEDSGAWRGLEDYKPFWDQAMIVKARQHSSPVTAAAAVAFRGSHSRSSSFSSSQRVDWYL